MPPNEEEEEAEGSTRPKSTRSSKRPISTKNQKEPNPKCRSRIDQLAVPNRRLILALYQNHADHLPKEKVEKIKALLQELYAMTPEETEKYFEHLRQQAEESGRRKDIKYMLKKLVRKKKKAKQVKKAYTFVNRLLVKGMRFALNHPIPPLVSVRLRNLSNIVLEQISNLIWVNVPNREDTDELGKLLIQVADWMAIAIEHLYYGVQLKKNKEMERIEEEAKAREKERKEKPKVEEVVVEPDVEGEEEEGSEAVLSEPLLLSEME